MSSETNDSVYSDARDKSIEDLDDVLTKIGMNICTQEESAENEALQKFKSLLQDYDEDIPLKIYKWSRGIAKEDITAILAEKVQDQIKKFINENPMKLISLIPVVETEIDSAYIVQVLLEAIEGLPDETTKKFLCDLVIPSMYYPTLNKSVHNVIIDFGSKLIETFPITKFSSQEVKLIISKLMDQHIKVLEKWREENFPRWHDLWMFLVKFFATHLHGAMDLANKLLRIVEFAFRNSSSEQRVKGYECWKAMIDNASLNMKHMTSTKQIKLLVTPLRAKFSKLEVVIGKRFEVFLYLLEKLQSNSVLCLTEFFEFCFGVSNTNFTPKNGQIRVVPNLHFITIEVVLAILGDQEHDPKELNRKLFEKPIIDQTNIEYFDPVIVYGVLECCSLLKLLSMNVREKLKILELLWKSLFNILKKAPKTVQRKVFDTIFNSLGILIKEYNEDVTYLGLLNAFAEISDSDVDHTLYDNSLKFVLDHFVEFLNAGTAIEDLSNSFEETFDKVCKNQHCHCILIEQLKKLKPSQNEDIVYKLWNILGTHTPEADSKSISSVLLWPVHHLNKSTSVAKNVCSKWTEFFSLLSNSNKILIINEMEKVFKSNPLLTCNISTIIASLAQDDLNLQIDIGKPVLKLMASIVSLPLLSEETAEKLLPMVLKCMNVVVASNDIDLEDVENICQCLLKVSDQQKDSTLLEITENLLKKISAHANTDTFNNLEKIISTFPIIAKLPKKTSKLRNTEGNITPSSSTKRSIRMTQMVFNKGGSTPNKEKVEALHLFGKDIETHTPLKVKGSILNNTPSPSNSRSKRILNSLKKSPAPNPPPINDEPTCEFAVIDTVVKLQKDLLTDHQKEKLRQRREDIPALYQDLSQSQTQSSLSTDTQSNHAVIVTDKNEVEEKSVNNPEEESMEFQKLELTMGEGPSSMLADTPQKQEEENEEDDDSENEKIKRIAKSRRELMKLQMNIAGGNSFIQNLPSKRPRKINEKVATLTPKKSKKIETATPNNDKNQNTVETSINMVPDVTEQKSTTVEEPENVQSICTEDSKTKEQATPNRRKNKLMKPIKNFDSPSSEKRKNRMEKKETSSGKKNTKRRKSPVASENQESETLFESELIQGVDKIKDTPVKKRTKSSDDVDKPNSEQETNQELSKPKKTSKELMKKNKEKVKTIQSQLKLANLSNLEGATEKNKPKSAKLIFIRELTNTKNPQDTKVCPAGLKRNKDNKSKNIAYTIETPSTSMDISTLVNIEGVESKSGKTENVKIKKKRKRKHSGETPDNSSSPDNDKKRRRTSKLKRRENEVDADVERNEDDAEKKAEKKDVSSESSLFSPDNSPSKSTRSRTSSPMIMKASPQKQASPKSVRTLFKESEDDIIESSQGSLLESSLLSRSKLKQSPRAVKIELESLTAITEEIKVDKPVSQATTLTCESNYEAQQPIVQVELPEKQELSDSEKMMSTADTVSIVSIEVEQKTHGICEKVDDGSLGKIAATEEKLDEPGSPVPNKIDIEFIVTPEKNSDLPSSPVSHATPTFKQELLNNTIDISPICSQMSPDPDDKATTDLIAALDAALGQEVEPELPKISEDDGAVTIPAEDEKPSGALPPNNERSNKLLNMVNSESPVTSHKKNHRWTLSSPGLKKTRYERLFSFYRKAENGETETNGDVPIAEEEGDMLTFSREVPSPLAVPSSSILKRKLADTDDSYSPCPKRKRVNFSYPCITSTKLFIRHRDELNAHYRPAFASDLFDEDEPQEEGSEEEDPFADPDAYSKVKTEESMDITNSLSLCSNKPIDERLINCEDNLDALWKRLSNPSNCDKLKNLLKSKNIETVGDLASMKEVEINRLPFRDPKLKTVRRALFHYYNKTFHKTKDKVMVSEIPTTSSEGENKKILGIENGSIGESVEVNNDEKVENTGNQPPENLKDEFRKILTKIKDKGISLEEYGDVLIDLIDESELISIMENVYNTNFRRFFGKPHWRFLIENIVKSGGTSELFDIISDLGENNTTFADQLEHVVQVRIDQYPLKNILKKKTLVQVSSSLQDCIKEGEFQRESVLQMCLMPLIKSPGDIRNYFNSLTIVQIHDIFIERVQPSDLTCFLDMIRDHYGNYTIAQCANKKDVLKICSKEDLVTALIEKENRVDVVKYVISDIDNQNQLLELYNYVGSLLPVKKKVEAHFDMLKIHFDNN